jgi:mono/diheme cytochrome c family protein
MKHTIKGGSAWLVIIFLGATGVAFSQKTEIKKAPIRETSPSSGQKMYDAYCAACHGKTGVGDGPAAVALKIPPPDLTTLAKRHGGKYPAYYVIGVLNFGVGYRAHGTSDMPIWGPLFSSLRGGDQAIVKMRITNLTHYIETLQEK